MSLPPEAPCASIGYPLGRNYPYEDYFKASVYGWLSKLGSLFGYPKYEVPYYSTDQKRDPNFDNYPYAFGAVLLLTPTKFSSSTSEGRIWDFPKMGDPNIAP